MPYLEDLRGRIYSSAVIFSLIFFVGFFLSASILKHFVAFFNIKDVVIATTSPFQFASLAVDIGFFCALICTLPLFMYHLFAFVLPALSSKERRKLLLSIPVSIFLFVFGFLYGFMIIYYSFALLAKINQNLGIQNIWDIGSFLSQLFLTSSLLGLVFQFPIVLSVFVKLGMLSVEFLRQKRKVAVLCIFVLVSLLPPTDGISLIAMGLPLILLYEATILINRNNKKYICLD